MVRNASHPADCSAIWPHLRLVWKGKNRTFTINGRFLHHKITLRGVIYMTTKQTCHISAISKNCMRLVTSQRAITFCKIFFHYSLTNFTFTAWPFPTERSSKSKDFFSKIYPQFSPISRWWYLEIFTNQKMFLFFSKIKLFP